jgi:hypothetical protein
MADERSHPTDPSEPSHEMVWGRVSSGRLLIVGYMTSTFGFTPGQPPEWDIERFMRDDEVDTAVITLERNRRTFARKSADVDADGLGLRLGAWSVTLGGLLNT